VNIAPLATQSEAFAAVQQRLSTSLSLGQFTAVLQKKATDGHVTPLMTAVSPFEGLSMSQVFTILFVHSAFPTSCPSMQPSSQPSSVPTAQPSSVPTLSHFTRFQNRLDYELSSRYPLDHREFRSLYYEMTIENISYYGGKGTWDKFVNEVLPLSAAGKAVASVGLLTINSTDEKTYEFLCEDPVIVKSIKDAMIYPTKRDLIVNCDGNEWKLKYCFANSSSPNICVNCENPCINNCLLAGKFLDMISSSYRPCSYDFGFIKLFSMDYYENEPGGNAAIISIGTLWGAFVGIFLVWFGVYQRQRTIKPAGGKFAPKNGDAGHNLARVHSAETNMSIITSKFDYLRFLYEGQGKFLYYARNLPFLHRDIRVLSDKKNGIYYGLCSATAIVFYAFFIQLFLNLWYPFDDGSCAEQLNSSDCSSLKSSFISYESVCVWIDNNSVEGAFLAERNNYQTSCFWKYAHITVRERILIGLITLLVMIPMKTILLEKVIKMYLLPKIKEKEEVIMSNDEVIIEPKKKVSWWQSLQLIFYPRRVKRMKDVENDEAFREGKFYRLKYVKESSNKVSPTDEEVPERMIMKLIKKEQIDEGLFTLEMDEVYKLPSEDHFRYAVKMEHSKMKLARRNAADIQFELFTSFAESLKTEALRQEIIENREFAMKWGLRNGVFDDDQVMLRELSWRLGNRCSRFQRIGDYYYEYLSYVSKLEETERKEASECPDTVGERILRLFVLDLLGYFNMESQVIRRRTYRDVTPRKPVYLIVKLFVVSMFLLGNVLLLFYFWDSFRKLNHERQYIWFSTFFICLLVDMGIIENIFTLWNYFIIPSLCYPKVEEALHAVSILHVKADSATANHPNISSKLAAQTKRIPFDVSKYFFISKLFANLFPDFKESRIVLEYRLTLPEHILKNETTSLTNATPSATSISKKFASCVLSLASLPFLVQYIAVAYLVVLFFFLLWFFLPVETYSLSLIWWIAAGIGALFLFAALCASRSTVFALIPGLRWLARNRTQTAVVHPGPTSPLDSSLENLESNELGQLSSDEESFLGDNDDDDEEEKDDNNNERIEIVIPNENDELSPSKTNQKKNGLQLPYRTPESKRKEAKGNSRSPTSSLDQKGSKVLTPPQSPNNQNYYSLADLFNEAPENHEEILKTLSKRELADLHQLSRSNSSSSTHKDH
jgi:hypothetical protein